jgi:hypothetical protein
MVSQTFSTALETQALAQGTGRVIPKPWWALLAAARESAAADRAQRYALHALVLGIGALSLVVAVW